MMPQSLFIFGLTHGTEGLILAYLLIVAPYILGLVRARASTVAFVWAPVACLVFLLIEAALAPLLAWLLHPLGVSKDGAIQWLCGAALGAGGAYFAGRHGSKSIKLADLYRRGS